MKIYDMRLFLVALAGVTVLATPAAASVCGDSEPDTGEQCDDGNTTNGDGCSSTCQVEAGADCTPAIASILDPLTPPVPSSCLVGVCGDGILSNGEACDDGNNASGDGCAALCQVEIGFACAGAATGLDILFGAVTRPSTCGPLGDIDSDGVPDTADNCMTVSNAQQRDTDGDGFGNKCDADLDNDCVVTACPGGFNDNATCLSPPYDDYDMELFKLVFFSNDPDADFNGDGAVNFVDLQILDSFVGLPPGPSGIPNVCDPGAPDTDGDGVPDDEDVCPGGDDNVNTDGDTMPDFCDVCPLDAANDADEDNVCGDVDNCPLVPNEDQADTDNNGVGNACNEGEDNDGDEWSNGLDNCPNTVNLNQLDTDVDGIGDACDGCPLDADNDADTDGVCGDVDNCPLVANDNQANTDGDEAGDACDADDDNDLVEDDDDNCQFDANTDQSDYDGDGAGDVCDTDDDNDGVLDANDACETAIGDLVNVDGCSIANLCPCDNNWKNHGAYVRCVSHAANDFKDAGLIGLTEHGNIVSAAGESACGKKNK